MTEQKTGNYKIPMLAGAALFVLWGVFGLLDAGNVAYSGYITDGNNTVTQVEEGSPAQAAGLEVGDYIRSIAGIPVEDTRALAQLGRPEIGETRRLVVERGAATTLAAGEEPPATREVALTYGAPLGRDVALTWAAFCIGLCFIGFGLFAYLKAPSRSATLLALMGLFLGVGFFLGPHFESYVVRATFTALGLVVAIFGFAFLLHFLMEFPKLKAIMERRHTTKLMYLPALLVALFALYLIAFAPRGTSGFNRFVVAMFGIFIVLYFGLSLWALIHSFVKATPDERSRFGLNLMLGGALIGLLPLTIAALVGILAPTVVLPGGRFFFLTMVLIPITMALAVVRADTAPEAAPAPVT
ncbi:MAG: PDZ domain-containing protein [Gemmatimonadales bacterium]|jgi:hypothetical protein